MEYYQPHLIVKYLVYFLMVWFFIASFSKRDRSINIIIFVMYAFNTWWFEPITFNYLSQEYRDQFILNKEFLVQVDVVFCLVMMVVNIKKPSAYLFKQWLLLSFVVLCHYMILWDLTMGKSSITGFFYTFYDELIIIVGILQVWVSRDGILGIVSRVQSFNYRILLSSICSRKNLFKRKTSKVKA